VVRTCNPATASATHRNQMFAMHSAKHVTKKLHEQNLIPASSNLPATVPRDGSRLKLDMLDCCIAPLSVLAPRSG